MEYLLYGLEQGETEQYMETLLYTKATTQAQIEKVIELAKANGFHSFRVATYNGEKPDFIKALKI